MTQMPRYLGNIKKTKPIIKFIRSLQECGHNMMDNELYLLQNKV